MSTGRWLALRSACLVAFLVPTLVPLDGPSALVRRSAFTAIVLGALGWATGR